VATHDVPECYGYLFFSAAGDKNEYKDEDD
jgi:hypothetical protein